jgi:hypothetical protein
VSRSVVVRRDPIVFPFGFRRRAGLLVAARVFCAGILSAGLIAASPFAASADETVPGSFTISASATSIAPGDHAFISVHRTGGADGVVSVSVDTGVLPAELTAVVAPIDTEVTFLDGDAADKIIPIVFLGDAPGEGAPDTTAPEDQMPDDQAPDDQDDHVPDAHVPDAHAQDNRINDAVLDMPALGGVAAHAGTSVLAPRTISRALAAADAGAAPLTVSLSAPAGGATLGTPSSVSISVSTPPTTTPADGGSDATGTTAGGTTPGGATGGTTTPGSSSKNRSGTTSPVGGGQSLADTGVNAILPFIAATLAAIAGLAALFMVRRRVAAPIE